MRQLKTSLTTGQVRSIATKLADLAKHPITGDLWQIFVEASRQQSLPLQTLVNLFEQAYESLTESGRSTLGAIDSILEPAHFDLRTNGDFAPESLTAFPVQLYGDTSDAANSSSAATSNAATEDPVVNAGRELVGHLRWRGGGGPSPSHRWRMSEWTFLGHTNDFVRWVYRRGNEPEDDSTMHCIDAVLFAAYRAGLVDRTWIRRLYDAAADSAMAEHRRHEYYDEYTRQNVLPEARLLPQVDDEYGEFVSAPSRAFFRTLRRGMVSGRLTRYYVDETTGVGEQEIPAGNIVFFNGPQGHVALSVGKRDRRGRHRVLSLWIHPRRFEATTEDPYGVGYMQETTVEGLLAAGQMTTAVVEFGNAAWPAAGSNRSRRSNLLRRLLGSSEPR
uniref:hypothetical protein n=1 Tax=Paractinoplanes polyasparticus TaxID=2856853 RepID=UPI001C86573C|nr:hypothetical protein [Actinoplanes polyasparticus]